MFPITKGVLDSVLASFGITDITKATIRRMCSVAAELEKTAGEDFIHLEIGNPGLPAATIGVEAECAALRGGIANQYPAIQGIPVVPRRTLQNSQRLSSTWTSSRNSSSPQ